MSSTQGMLCCLAQKRSSVKKGGSAGSEEGNHSKAAVNNFLGLNSLKICGTLSVKKSKEIPTNVTRGALSIVLVEGSKLNGTDGSEDLHVSGESNLRNSGERVSVGELLTRDMPSRPERSVFLSDHSDDSKHADASMLQLRPTCVLQVRLNFRQAHRVETNITSHGSIELFWADQEWNGLGHLSVQGNNSPRRLKRKKTC